MTNNYDCTVLVNSYDQGEDLWDGFFTCFKINWPDNPFEIVLNTENKNYDYEDLKIKTFNLFPKKRPSWAYQLKKTLEKIDTKYILFFLDDFWIDNKIDSNFVFNMINIMDNDQDISNISFRNMPYKNINDGKYELLEKRGTDYHYTFNCQASLWRREKFIKYLRNHESAWDWELYGSMRAKRFNDKFYCIKKDVAEPFVYSEGGVLHRGKWIKEYADYFSKKYNIKIDYSKRGYETLEQFHRIYPRSTLYEKIFKPHFFRRLKDTIHLYIHKFLSNI